MKKIFVGVLIVIAILFCIVAPCYFIYDVFSILEKTELEVNSNIGAKVILNKDTLVVVDHSYLSSTYTLSNNVKIETSLIDSIKINKIKNEENRD